MLIRFSQLSSLVHKRLSNVRAFRQTPDITVSTVIYLDHQLHMLKESMSYILQVDAPINPSKLPKCISLTQALHLQFMYYHIMFDIHTTLTYPWSQALHTLQENSEHRKQIDLSYSRVANAARGLILATKWVHLDANCATL